MWKPRTAEHDCAYCGRLRPFTEGKCDYCGSMAPAAAPESSYTARLLANGDAAVLERDGLTWISRFSSFSEAERYAGRLNDWLAARPTPDELVPITDSFAAPPAPAITDELVARLERICEKLAGPDNVRLPLEGSDLWTSS